MVSVVEKIILKTNVKNLTGPKIRFYREQRGWTQHAFAQKLQAMGVPITRCIIANIEVQRCSVTDCQIASIARALQIPVVLFFSDEPSGDFNGALKTNPAMENLPRKNQQPKLHRGIFRLLRKFFGQA